MITTLKSTITKLSSSAPGFTGVLPAGATALRPLLLLHNIYSPVGRRVMMNVGLRPGMKVADFGCGFGAMTRIFAEIVGPSGSVTGIDANEGQLVRAGHLWEQSPLTNLLFWKADASATRLPGDSFDLVYCRFLLSHLPGPEGCLREMRRVLKPGGILVVEEGDFSESPSATSLEAFSGLFTRLGPVRGANNLSGKDLCHIVMRSGFTGVTIENHQPAFPRGEDRARLSGSIEQAGQGCVDAGLMTEEQFALTLAEMQIAIDNPSVPVLMPRMSLVWARKTQ
jgi:SAM-dependent methyltransferase